MSLFEEMSNAALGIATPAAQPTSEFERKSLEALKPKKSPFISTVNTTVAGIGNAVAGQPLEDVGAKLGLQPLQDFGRGVRESYERVQEANPSSINSISDAIANPGDAVATALGNALPQIPASAASAMGGARAGAALGAMTPFPGGAAIGGVIGGLGGAVLGALPQEYAEIRGKQRENGSEDMGKALATAVPAAGLEAVGDVITLGKFMPKGLSGMASDVLSETGSRLGHVTKQAAKGVAGESATEYAQTALEQLGGNQDMTTQQAADERNVGALLGGIGGGVIKGGLSIADKRKASPTTGEQLPDNLDTSATLGNALSAGAITIEQPLHQNDAGTTENRIAGERAATDAIAVGAIEQGSPRAESFDQTTGGQDEVSAADQWQPTHIADDGAELAYREDEQGPYFEGKDGDQYDFNPDIAPIGNAQEPAELLAAESTAESSGNLPATENLAPTAADSTASTVAQNNPPLPADTAQNVEQQGQEGPLSQEAVPQATETAAFAPTHELPTGEPVALREDADGPYFETADGTQFEFDANAIPLQEPANAHNPASSLIADNPRTAGADTETGSPGFGIAAEPVGMGRDSVDGGTGRDAARLGTADATTIARTALNRDYLTAQGISEAKANLIEQKIAEGKDPEKTVISLVGKKAAQQLDFNQVFNGQSQNTALQETAAGETLNAKTQPVLSNTGTNPTGTAAPLGAGQAPAGVSGAKKVSDNGPFARFERLTEIDSQGFLIDKGALEVALDATVDKKERAALRKLAHKQKNGEIILDPGFIGHVVDSNLWSRDLLGLAIDRYEAKQSTSTANKAAEPVHIGKFQASCRLNVKTYAVILFWLEGSWFELFWASA